MGDININALENSSIFSCLRALLAVYNLCRLEDSPNRVFGSSATAIDNVIINVSLNKVFLETLWTGFSDHFAQGLTVGLPDFHHNLHKNKLENLILQILNFNIDTTNRKFEYTLK